MAKFGAILAQGILDAGNFLSIKAVKSSKTLIRASGSVLGLLKPMVKRIWKPGALANLELFIITWEFHRRRLITKGVIVTGVSELP